ncbi:MAG: CAP domain-containing protein [Salinibacter sp.]
MTRLRSLFWIGVLPLILSGIPVGEHADNGTAHPWSSPAGTSPDTLHDVTQDVFDHTNAERQDAGRAALKRNAGLTELACRHSRDMLVRDFMGHESPDGIGPKQRAARHHRRLVGETGENVLSREGSAPQSPEALGAELVTRWMESPSHRANILRRAFTHMGVCVMQDGDQMRATQSFARIRGMLSSPLPEQVTAGNEVPVRVTSVPDSRMNASKYDLWSPEEERRVAGPRALAGTLHVPDTTGVLRPRFYFPDSDRYAVHLGPSFTVERAASSMDGPSSQRE